MVHTSSTGRGSDCVRKGTGPLGLIGGTAIPSSYFQLFRSFVSLLLTAHKVKITLKIFLNLLLKGFIKSGTLF